MTTLSVKEIEHLLEADGGWREWYGSIEPVVVDGLGDVYVPEDIGGEGQGDHRELVFRIGDRYFKKTGYYASHDGTTWDGPFSEVRPVEKMITVYE